MKRNICTLFMRQNIETSTLTHVTLADERYAFSFFLIYFKATVRILFAENNMSVTHPQNYSVQWL
jgi:penicillin-binding protein-related factor A (putative recombinase)